jgi:hypothetical protein
MYEILLENNHSKLFAVAFKSAKSECMSVIVLSLQILHAPHTGPRQRNYRKQDFICDYNYFLYTTILE